MPAGAHLTNAFPSKLQFYKKKMYLSVIPFLAMISHQILAHALTAQLSCHAQKLVTMSALEFEWEQNVVFI